MPLYHNMLCSPSANSAKPTTAESFLDYLNLNFKAADPNNDPVGNVFFPLVFCLLALCSAAGILKYKGIIK
jgi:hypothetical protein